jgi:hypothetical protein
MEREIKTAEKTPLKELSPATMQALIQRASSSGRSVDDYLKELLGIINGEVSAGSVEEFVSAMESLADDTAHLPAERIRYTREDIYFDHD